MRYLVLLLLNLPIILLALLNIITQFKTGKVTRKRFRRQMTLWSAVLVVIIGSFPVYNLTVGRPPLDSTSLSAFDIVEITMIVFLFYAVNDQIRKLDQTERRLRELHQELSIILSEKK